MVRIIFFLIFLLIFCSFDFLKPAWAGSLQKDVRLQHPGFSEGQRDYLDMDSIEAQLDPESKIKASQLVKQPSKKNIFDRIVVPKREYLKPEGRNPAETVPDD